MIHINSIIKSFADEPLTATCATQNGAYLNCWNISINFLHLCNILGLDDTNLVYVKGFRPPQETYEIGGRRWPFTGTPDSHYVARVGTRYYDWTCRQFDPRAPFPLVFESETGLAEVWEFRHPLKFLQAVAIFRGKGVFHVPRGLSFEQWTLSELFDENMPRWRIIGPLKFQETYPDLRCGTTGRLALFKDVPIRASQIRANECLLLAPRRNAELIELLTKTGAIEPTARSIPTWGKPTTIHRISTPVTHLPYSNVPATFRAVDNE